MSVINKVSISLDSNDRFEKKYKHLPFWQLPHNENGFNIFNAELIDGILYYKKQKVFALDDLAKYSNISKDNDDANNSEDSEDTPTLIPFTDPEGLEDSETGEDLEDALDLDFMI